MEIEFHDDGFKEWQFIILTEEFFHHYELEVAYLVVALLAIVPAGDIHLLLATRSSTTF